MNLNTICLWLGAMPAATLFWRSIRAPHRPFGWIAVSAFVLLSSGCGWLWFPDSAGYVASALMLLLIVLPARLHNAAGRARARLQHTRARRLFALAAVLHPFDGWPAMPHLLEASELSYLGKNADADALLQVLASGEGKVAAMAQAQRLRNLGRWRELKALCQRDGLAALGRDATLLSYYLRALGELGEIDELAEFMRAQESTLVATGTLSVGFLSLFAFSGQVELTGQALDSAGPVYTAETRNFWLAVALKHAGDEEGARRAFGRLRESDDRYIRERAESHFMGLSATSAEPRPSARTLELVAYFARTLAQRRNLIPNSPGQRGERRITLLLIAVNTAVYFVGSTRSLLDTSATFGERWSFFAPDILAGEWWRALSYLFVHANALHLVMNMAGLWVLGPFVERAFGRLRFSLIYLIAGCTGSAVYLTLAWLKWIEPEPLVGASGCIMGLLGATGAVMLRAWIRQRAAVARQMFFRLLAVVALQVVFDLSTPQVAGLAHALGLLGGFAAGLVLREGVSPERPAALLS